MTTEKKTPLRQHVFSQPIALAKFRGLAKNNVIVRRLHVAVLPIKPRFLLVGKYFVYLVYPRLGRYKHTSVTNTRGVRGGD